MKIEFNGTTTMEELELALVLVARCTAMLACGCSLDDDEHGLAEDLVMVSREYCIAYDQRFG